MKPKVSASIVVLMFLIAGQAHGVTDKIFTSSGQILPGEEWNTVDIYNDDTVVDMLGGLVDRMQTFDASTLNATAGEVFSIYAWNSSQVDISGGYMASSSAWDHSTINFLEGASGHSLSAREFGTVNVSGGILKYARAGDQGILNLMGGLVTDSLNAWGTAAVNVFGYDLVKTSTGGAYGYGRVYGFWPDHTSFTIDLYDAQTYNHITLVPEPSSLLIFGLGALLLSVHRKKQ